MECTGHRPSPEDRTVHSIPAFLAVAAAVTLTPGPAFALLVQTALRHGRQVAWCTIAGNAVGVLAWGALSAAGVSALVVANRLAFEALRLTGAVFLLWLGVRCLLGRPPTTPPRSPTSASSPSLTGASSPGWRAARRGVINGVANPKLAVFFVALFPQFITPGAPVLPAALAMAATIVAMDVIWFGAVAAVVDRFRRAMRPHVVRRLEQGSGAVLLGVGVRLATEAR